MMMLLMTMMVMVMMVMMMMMCVVLALLTRPTQRLLLTPNSSCIEPILGQFELTGDADNNDEEKVS